MNNVPDEKESPKEVSECKKCGRKSEVVDMRYCPFCTHDDTVPSPEPSLDSLVQEKLKEFEKQFFGEDKVAYIPKNSALTWLSQAFTDIVRESKKDVEKCEWVPCDQPAKYLEPSGDGRLVNVCTPHRRLLRKQKDIQGHS